MDKEILKGLADNQMLFDAVKKQILGKFDLEKLYKDWDATDATIGQSVRSTLTGRKAIEAAFDEIATYKTIKGAPEKQNPAR